MFLFCFFVFDLIVLSWTQVSFVHNGNEYVINNKKMNHTSARNSCESINSTLVVMNDNIKNTLVDKIRENFTEPITRFWIKSIKITPQTYIQILLRSHKYRQINKTVRFCFALEVRFTPKNNNNKWRAIPCDISSNEIDSLPGYICQKPAPLRANIRAENEEISQTTTIPTATSDMIDFNTSLTSFTIPPTLFFNPVYSAIVIAISSGCVFIFLLVLSFIYVYFKFIRIKRKNKSENLQLRRNRSEENELYSVNYNVDVKTSDENIIYNIPST